MKRTFLRFALTGLLTFLMTAGAGKLDAVAADPETTTLEFYTPEGEALAAPPVSIPFSRLGVAPYAVYFSTVFNHPETYGLTREQILRIYDGHEISAFQISYNDPLEGTSEYTTLEELKSVDYVVPPVGSPDTKKSYILSRKNYRVVPVLKTEYVQFPINYNAYGAKLPSNAAKYVTTEEGKSVTLPTSLSREGYEFGGWYRSTSFNESEKVTKLTANDVCDLNYADSNKTIPSISVYAKWNKLSITRPTIKKLSNSASGKVYVYIEKPTASTVGYEVEFCTNTKFTGNLHTAEGLVGEKILATSLTKGKKYYFRARAYILDSAQKRVYSNYSKVVSISITKGEAEVKATSTSATLSAVKVIGNSAKYLSVSASVPKRVKSIDDFYYLVRVNPSTGAYYSQITKTPKDKTLSFSVPLVSSSGVNYYAGKFAIAVLSATDKYTIISPAKFIQNPAAAAKYTGKYPTPTSKKGRQGTYVKDDGDKNYFYNICIDSILSTKAEGGEAFKYNGKTYYFKQTNQALDKTISTVNQDGGTVTLQIMLRYTSKSKSLIKKTALANTSKRYYAFNVEDTASRNYIEAAFYWLTNRYSQTNMHVDNWILGNEVNTFKNPEGWYWAGNISNSEFVKNYAQTFRILYYAATSNYKYARVFTCVDHTFNDRGYEWGVKNFLPAFSKELKSLDSNIKWNLAYHAYSAVLTNADFWNDNTSSLYTANNDPSASFVSPLNIEVLVKFVRDNFGKNVHIILSEQGFSHTGGTNSAVNGGRASGENVQAAAVTYLFYKAMFNSDIDAVIYHTVDEKQPGMNFNFKTATYNAYKYMDTPSFSKYTTSCLGTISKTGKNKVTSWSQIVPNFDASKLKNMPAR